MTKVKEFIDNAIVNKTFPAAGALIIDNKGHIILQEYSGTIDASVETSPSFNPHTSTTLASCTKLITSIAALQLIEQGELALSDFVEKYIPEVANFQVLESIVDGKPTYRPAKNKPTIKDLMTHTSGLAYDFFDADILAWTISQRRNPSEYYSVATKESFESPLMAEPGTKYVYGTSTDFLGEVVQKVSGMRLSKYLHTKILEPLKMNETFARETLKDVERLATHIKIDNGFIALPDNLAEMPAFGGGGGYLSSSMNDFGRLLTTLLNGGIDESSGVRILKEETVKKYLFSDCLNEDVDRTMIGKIDAAIPQITNHGELLDIPVEKRGVSCGGLLVNSVDMASGRKTGSVFWCGFMNVYYWMDPENKIGGVAVTNMLPFMYQPALDLFDLLQKEAYGK